MKRTPGKVPYGWRGADVLAVILVVRKLLQRTRGIRYTVPTTVDAIKWHTSTRGPWLGGVNRNHVWLSRAYSKCGHALAFAEGLVQPGSLKREEADAIAEHFPATETFGPMERTVKPRKPRKPKIDKLAKAQADVRRWTVEIVRRQRAVQMARKKLASAQRSERAILRARETQPIEKASDATLAARVRALRNPLGHNPATALGHE